MRRARRAPAHLVLWVNCVNSAKKFICEHVLNSNWCVCVCVSGPFFECGVLKIAAIMAFDTLRLRLWSSSHRYHIYTRTLPRNHRNGESSGRERKRKKKKNEIPIWFARPIRKHIFHNSLLNLLSLFLNSAQCMARPWHTTELRRSKISSLFANNAPVSSNTSTFGIGIEMSPRAIFQLNLGWTLLYCHFGLMKSSRYIGSKAIIFDKCFTLHVPLISC